MIDNDYSDPSELESRRTANIISFLLPARMYRLECSWTTEQSLPAMEEFSCRLLLMLERLYPSEIQNYFGLDGKEREVLIDSLLTKRLATIDPDGSLVPSALVRAKARGLSDYVPSLTLFEERQETAVLDLLTLNLLWKSTYQGTKWGLPEISASVDFSKASADEVSEAFSRQYKAHLENTRKPGEAQRTRLYKVGQCRQDRTLQVPIDMAVQLEAVQGEEPRVIRDVGEKVGQTRRFALSNELEAKIADYLGALQVRKDGISIEDWCTVMGDQVLQRYAHGNSFDLSGWLLDRDRNKTGYGSPDTRGIIGPVYLRNNRTHIERWLQQFSSDHGGSRLGKAYWLPANVPLWAANGSELSDFVRRISNISTRRGDNDGELVALFPTQDKIEHFSLEKTYSQRIPYGIALWQASPLDRQEILVFQNAFAIAQYHIQPNENSGITVPLGFMTRDPVRMSRIESCLRERLKPAWNYSVLWPRNDHSAANLLDFEYLDLGHVQDKHENFERSHSPSSSQKEAR